MREVYHWDRELQRVVEGPAPRVVKFAQAPSVWGGFEPFESPATGKIISDRAQHREDLKVSGCTVLEPGIHKGDYSRPVNPKYADNPQYDQDYSKEWYQKREEAARTPFDPALTGLPASDRTASHRNPHEVD